MLHKHNQVNKSALLVDLLSSETKNQILILLFGKDYTVNKTGTNMIILYFADMADLKIKQTKAKQHCDFYLFIYLICIYLFIWWAPTKQLQMCRLHSINSH